LMGEILLLQKLHVAPELDEKAGLLQNLARDASSEGAVVPLVKAESMAVTAPAPQVDYDGAVVPLTSNVKPWPEKITNGEKKEWLLQLVSEFVIEEFVGPLTTHHKKWLDELAEELNGQEVKLMKIMEGLLEADRVFTVAKGRSDLALRSTGMRLMQEGMDMQACGDPYTMAIGTDPRFKDAVLFYSGSGETPYVKSTLNVAHDNNVPIFGVSSNIDSTAVRLAGVDNVLLVKGKKIYPRGTKVPPESTQPINFLQTKGEFKSYLIGELIVNWLAKVKNLTEEDFKLRHANTE